ncbi:MAG: conserved membrane protein of unknown function [Promethearchaeota archaeon]|nr:MAG: conserved membrane protein of unknown function [Candidatus Lokiarchaeota archaeon]
MEEEFLTQYNKKQEKLGTLIYLALVAGWFVTILGSVWTLVNIFNPGQGVQNFFSKNIGYLLAGIFGFLFFVFFLLVFFVGFYRRGRKRILKILYTKKELSAQYRDRLGIKIVAGGFIISILGLVITIIIAMILSASSGSEDSVLMALISIITLSTGTLILTIGISIFLVIGLILFLTYTIRNGFYFIAKIIYKMSE